MAIEKIEPTTIPRVDLQGLSTDAKPTTGIAAQSTFYEIDTGNAWVFSVVNTNPATSNGWWAA